MCRPRVGLALADALTGVAEIRRAQLQLRQLQPITKREVEA
jgi:hypothetical protein